MKRELERLLDRASEEGATVQRTGGGHWKVTAPDGSTCYCPATPSDYRGVRNVRAKLRRIGLNVD